MDENKQKLIDQFSAIAGTDAERSLFFLESAGMNIETALSSFYEESEELPAESEPVVDPSPTTQGPSMPSMMMMSDDSGSEEEGQAFYAGGSETSGQQVIGPKKKKNKDVVSRLFKSAKDHGAEVMDPKDAGKGKSKKSTFAGTGYKLGETEDDHEVVQGAKVDEPPRDVVLRMWKTGFTVDDGSLRTYEDPANHEFLNSVRRGQIPLELIKNAKGGEVYINMEDHRQEEYLTPRQKTKAFQGTGNTLGSVTPTVVGQVTDTGTRGGAAGSSRIPTAASLSDAISSNGEQKAKENLTVDSSQPTTNIQVRLPNGSRLVLKANHSHTVGDIRQYASTARPSLPPTFSLMTTFPYAELKDDSQTISEAKLLNSSIVIK